MGVFTQPQQTYAGTGDNRNIVVAVIYPVNQTFFLHIIWVCKHSDFEFERKQRILKYV